MYPHNGENGRFYGENDQFYVENVPEKCFENEPHSVAVDQKIDWGHSGDLGGAACNVVQPMVDDSERGMYLRNGDFSANSGEYGAGYGDFEYMQAVLDGVNDAQPPSYDDPGLSGVRTEGPYGQKSDLDWEAGCFSSSNSASGGDCGLGGDSELQSGTSNIKMSTDNCTRKSGGGCSQGADAFTHRALRAD